MRKDGVRRRPVVEDEFRVARKRSPTGLAAALTLNDAVSQAAFWRCGLQTDLGLPRTTLATVEDGWQWGDTHESQ